MLEVGSYNVLKRSFQKVAQVQAQNNLPSFFEDVKNGEPDVEMNDENGGG